MLSSLLLVILLFAGEAMTQQYFDLYGSNNVEDILDIVPSSNSIKTANEVKPEVTMTVTPEPPRTVGTVNISNLTELTQSRDFSAEPTRSSAIIVYESTLSTVLVLALLCSVVLGIRVCVRRRKRKKLEHELALTPLDARLSSQFLTDFPENGRTLRTASFEVPTPKRSSVTINVIAAVPPIPSEICLTSPKGAKRKSLWHIEEHKMDVYTNSTPKKSIRKNSASIPNLTGGSSFEIPNLTGGSSSEERGNTRREAVFFHSDDEETIADLKALKKKYKKRNKRWKK